MTKSQQILKTFSEQLGLLQLIAENDTLLARSIAARNLSLHNKEHHRGFFDGDSAHEREGKAIEEIARLKIQFKENQVKLNELIAGAALELA